MRQHGTSPALTVSALTEAQIPAAQSVRWWPSTALSLRETQRLDDEAARARCSAKEHVLGCE